MLSRTLQVFPQISRFFDLDLQVFGLLGLRGLVPAVLEWSVDVSSVIFVELVCKVQLNIVFNGLRVPDFQRHTNGNSCLLCFSMTCKY